ncbi:hypothetical protein [Pseudarthrobacter sp. LT1]|uniref:hypothetical protein n=1 Tax=Pseudarthrobacter sp. LT1 TaxID=3111450 RepID=UPI002D780D9F|nr:hypothetical protein [Pseudarthrobacter sp. LT1]WRT14999.1 hypothetical protein VIK36_05775 [Pseudarthrobacter sp. LT1]
MDRWDLGIAGLGLLATMSVAFGLVTHVIVGKRVSRWLWIYAAAGYFVAGILVSEVWFGWATEEELQPNIDGLSFDEVQLVTLAGLIAAVTARIVLRKRARKGVRQAPPPGAAH